MFCGRGSASAVLRGYRGSRGHQNH